MRENHATLEKLHLINPMAKLSYCLTLVILLFASCSSDETNHLGNYDVLFVVKNSSENEKKLLASIMYSHTTEKSILAVRESRLNDDITFAYKFDEAESLLNKKEKSLMIKKALSNSSNKKNIRLITKWQ